MSAKNSNVSTLATALILCLVCSVMVSAVAVGLKAQQKANATLDLNKNILVAAGKLISLIGLKLNSSIGNVIFNSNELLRFCSDFFVQLHLALVRALG